MTINEHRLAVKPVGYPGESISSLLLRGAKANGWPSGEQFIRAALRSTAGSEACFGKVTTEAAGRKRLFERLGICLGNAVQVRKEQSDASGSFLRWGSVAIQRDHLTFGAGKVCVACLAEDREPFSRAVWEHRLYQSCPIHGVSLISHCPSCSKQLDAFRLRPEFCGCGFDLRAFSSQTASSGLLSGPFVMDCLSSRASSRLTAATELMADLELLADQGVQMPTSCAEMAAALIDGHQESMDQFTQSFDGNTGAHQTHVRVAFRRLISTESNHARRFLQALSQRGIRWLPTHSPPSEARLRRTAVISVLGASQRIAEQLGRGGVLRWQVNESDSSPTYSVRDCNDFLMGLEKSASSAIPKNRLVSLSAAKVSNAWQLVAEGVLKFSPFDLQKGIASLQVAPESQPDPDRDTYLDMRQIAQLMDCHYENVRFLVRSGFLKADKRKGVKYLFDKARAAQFVADFQFAGAVARSVGEPTSRFSEQIMHFGVEPVSGPSVDGGLCYLFKAKDIRNLDLRAVANTRDYQTRSGRPGKLAPSKSSTDRPAGATPLTEAASRLGLSVQRVRILVENGELALAETALRARHIATESLEAFHEQFHGSMWEKVATACRARKISLGQFNRRFVATGIVETRKIAGQLQYKVADLSAFEAELESKQHVFAVDACKSLGVGRSAHRNHEATNHLGGLERHCGDSALSVCTMPKSAIHVIKSADE